jgi:hypothetical protein
VSFVGVHVRCTSRARSPEFVPLWPSAPPSYTSSTSPAHLPWCPKSIHYATSHVPGQSARQSEHHSSKSMELAGGLPRAAAAGRSAQICLNRGQPVKVPVHPTDLTLFTKEPLVFPCFAKRSTAEQRSLHKGPFLFCFKPSALWF